MLKLGASEQTHKNGTSKDQQYLKNTLYTTLERPITIIFIIKSRHSVSKPQNWYLKGSTIYYETIDYVKVRSQ